MRRRAASAASSLSRCRLRPRCSTVTSSSRVASTSRWARSSSATLAGSFGRRSAWSRPSSADSTTAALPLNHGYMTALASSRRITAHAGARRTLSSSVSSDTGGGGGDLVVPPKSTTTDTTTTPAAVAVPESSSSSLNVPALPIDFDIASKISGAESQILEVHLKPGNALRAESGAMLYMTSGVDMNTTLSDGGVSAGVKRMLTGQNLFLADYTYTGQEGTRGTVCLGTDFPSKILRLNLREYDHKIICQKGAYLASSADSVDIEMEFARKMTAGFFGGEGFVLQALVGSGDVFVKAGGTLVKRELRAGETLRVSSGCLVAFTREVQFDVQTMPGFKNVVFGGEGLFVTALTGPGTVWLQGMPPARMISEIARKVPSGGGGIGLGIPMMMGGGGGEGEGEGGADADADGDAGSDGLGGAEEAVAATDAAVEADRQAAVASSGLSGGDSGGSPPIDAESPGALFGDAAPSPEGGGAAQESTPSEMNFGGNHDDDSTTSFSTDDTTADFGEDLTSSQQQQAEQFDDFEDQTEFSTFEDEQQQSSAAEDDEFDAGDFGGGGGDEEGGSSGILSTLWDMFTGNDD